MIQQPKDRPAPELAVMVVDDEPDTVNEFVEMLQTAGMRTCSASSFDQARRLLGSRDDIGLMVTDIAMPGGTGLDLIEGVVHGGDNFMQFIIITGYPEVDYAVRALRNRVFDFFTKPFDELKFLDSARRALGKALMAHRDINPDVQALRAMQKQRFIRDELFQGFDFTEVDWQILSELTLARLEHKNLDTTGLIAGINASSTTVWRRIQRLIDAGLVARIPDRRDSRRMYLSLTDKAFGSLRKLAVNGGI